MLHKETRHGDRIIHEWTFQPLPYTPPEDHTVSTVDYAPRVWVSSFKDTQAAGDAFCKRAVPMSEVTPAIQELAAKITVGTDGRRDQARAIFNWVASNVRYISTDLNSGGWVPNPAGSILQNRYGDCKDHATLMRALLAAKGVQSELVEINSAAVYKPFPIPLQHYDHLILYVPEFDAYVDPTAKYSTFDSLPDHLSDKPALHCGVDGKVRMSRVPPSSETVHTLVVKGNVTIHADGSATGEATVTGTGSGAETLRQFSAQIERSGTEAALKARFDSLNVNGTARIERQSPDDRSEPYSVRMTFTISDSYLGEDNSRVISAGPDLIDEPFWVFKRVVRAGRTVDFPCLPTSFRQDITYTLPPGWVPRPPANVSQKAGPVEFSARYVHNGRTFEAHRSYVLRTKGSVCPAAMAKTLVPVIKAAVHDANEWLAIVPENTPTSVKY